MLEWLRCLFLAPEVALTSEQQSSLFLTTTELHMFASGLRGLTGVDRDGSLFSAKISAETAKWAIPYAKLIAEATQDFKNGDLRRALRKFQNIHHRLPNDAVVLMNIGVCYGDLGNKEDAKYWLRQALQVVPPEHRPLLEENMRRCDTMCL